MALRVGVCLAALVGACEGFVGPHLSGRFVSFVAPALRYSPGMHALGRWGFPAEWRRVEAGMAPHGSEGGGDAAAGNSTSIFERVGAFGNLRSGGGGFVPPDERPEEPNYSVKPASENSVLKSAAEGKGVFDDMQKKANFDDLVQFPCVFTIKVVGVRQGEFTEDILDAVGGVVGRTRDELKHSVRDNGKWRSITVEVPVQTSEQLYAVYEAVGKDPRVKFKF